MQLMTKNQINMSNPSATFAWGYNDQGRNRTRFYCGKDPSWHMLKTPPTPIGDSGSISDK